MPVSIDINDKPENAEPSMNWSDGGRTSRRKFDPENADDSSRFNFESASKINSASESHDEKQYSPMISTDFGTTSRRKLDRENADDSSRINFESASKLNSSSDLHDEKQEDPMISIDFPISTRRCEPKYRINSHLLIFLRNES
jgi:hypothetical protein